MLRKALISMGIPFLAVVMITRVEAQLTTTTLLGRVTDATGAAILGAQVTATNKDTNLSRVVQTNDDGEYRIDFLPAGNYELLVNASGFKKAVRRGIVLQVSIDARVDVKLEVGAVSENY